MQKLRPKSDREFFDTDLGKTARDKVSELVNNDEHAKNDQGR